MRSASLGRPREARTLRRKVGPQLPRTRRTVSKPAAGALELPPRSSAAFVVRGVLTYTWLFIE